MQPLCFVSGATVSQSRTILPGRWACGVDLAELSAKFKQNFLIMGHARVTCRLSVCPRGTTAMQY
jgi:hypothetical protein